MHTAKLPVHRDLAGFDFEHSNVDHAPIGDFSDLVFTEEARNVVLIGGTGTGKTHLATVLGVWMAASKREPCWRTSSRP